MKQIKKEPQAPRLPLALETVVLTSALAAQEKLIGLEINDDLWPEEKALGKEFSECRLTKVTMAAISEKNYFVDVIFDHCRMTGADLSRCVLQDVVFLNCALDYSNFAFSSFKSCRFADCICTQSSFSEGKFTAFEIQRCKLDESEFFHSHLNGVDLSTCTIEGIALCGDERKGVIVNPSQAVDLARVLGIVIKEE